MCTPSPYHPVKAPVAPQLFRNAVIKELDPALARINQVAIAPRNRLGAFLAYSEKAKWLAKPPISGARAFWRFALGLFARVDPDEFFQDVVRK